MNDERFERLLENWSAEEKKGLPDLRPKPEMYQALKAKRRRAFFPVFVRWATAGVAAVIVMIVTFFHPSVFQKPAHFEQAPEQQLIVGTTASDDKIERVKEEAPGLADAELDVSRERLYETHDAAPALAPSRALPKAEGLTASKKSIQTTKVKTVSAQPAESGELTDSRKAPEPDKSTRMSSSMESPQTINDIPLSETGDEQETASTVKVCRIDEQTNDSKALQIGSKTFFLHDGVWIDTEHSRQKARIAIQRDSQAYHDLLNVIPELQQYFERCLPMVVNIGAYSIELADEGNAILTKEELQQLSNSFD
ncbi:hypothetical protein CSA56_12660 [candidate division KSB3 bacterium]|uniref:Uncharacterized protein n=1 Tax=candidate division KSB3 bacterium TaxID=2044937 RepID=A0A2G6KC13_9BACT|nr:MAG: hypothetical protein CSA56_12660 [candidate division KSB3 bacterium]